MLEQRKQIAMKETAHMADIQTLEERLHSLEDFDREKVRICHETCSVFWFCPYLFFGHLLCSAFCTAHDESENRAARGAAGSGATGTQARAARVRRFCVSFMASVSGLRLPA
jgi:hypothetical protein